MNFANLFDFCNFMVLILLLPALSQTGAAPFGLEDPPCGVPRKLRGQVFVEVHLGQSWVSYSGNKISRIKVRGGFIPCVLRITYPYA